MKTEIFTAAGLGAKIRARRETLGYTQQALADAIGASRKFVVELEAGKDNASLGLALRALEALGFDAPEASAESAQGQQFLTEFEATLGARDYDYALRLMGEYASASLAAGRALMLSAPRINDTEYLAALGATTRWIARKTNTPVPRWSQRISPSTAPVFLAEKLHPVSDRMKNLIRSETPPEMKEMNVWIRERDLATA